MCQLFEVSTSGYYRWLKHEASKREQANEALLVKIKQIHTDLMQTYGAPRVHAELRAQGTRVGRKRVARLMQKAGLCGLSRRRRVKTTTRSAKDEQRPDLVERDFTADAPDQLWVADITYVPTAGGFLYLAVVLDVLSRRIVGWAMAHHLRTELVLAALNMAVEQRNPERVIHHSDRGSQLGFNRSLQHQWRVMIEYVSS
ncbi:MAG: IS3 family transposase [Bacteroidota bacterium]